jgi:hypothetical protein
VFYGLVFVAFNEKEIIKKKKKEKEKKRRQNILYENKCNT